MGYAATRASDGEGKGGTEGAEVGAVSPGGEGGGELEEALDTEEGLGLGGGELLGGGGEQEAEDEDGEADGFGP